MKIISDDKFREYEQAEEVYKYSLRGMQKVIDRYKFDLDRKNEEIQVLRGQINDMCKTIECLKQDKERYRKMAYDIDRVRKELLGK